VGMDSIPRMVGWFDSDQKRYAHKRRVPRGSKKTDVAWLGGDLANGGLNVGVVIFSCEENQKHLHRTDRWGTRPGGGRRVRLVGDLWDTVHL